MSSTCLYLKQFADSNGLLPTIVPIALIQKPLCNTDSSITLGSFAVFSKGPKARACVITLSKAGVALLDDLSSSDVTSCCMIIDRNKLYMQYFYHDNYITEVDARVEKLIDSFSWAHPVIIATESTST